MDDGVFTTSYVYDSANQLIRENNEEYGFTNTWEYDNAGNILCRKEYGFTTGSLEGVTPIDTVVYTYDTELGWGDLLVGYDGNTITHDGVGNPLSDGTWTYTWKHGRQLESMSDSDVTWTYQYNADGLRTYRYSDDASYYYSYIGDKLWHYIKDYTSFTITYDAMGMPYSLDRNGVTYYYILNLQGDVVAINDDEGNMVVYYVYDAWGNLISMTDTSGCGLGTGNVLRYRGYVYDTETGLYYLQSRYYNPELGRFINADRLLDIEQGALGNNLFAYCGNNPIINIDSTGMLYERGAGGGGGGACIYLPQNAVNVVDTFLGYIKSASVAIGTLISADYIVNKAIQKTNVKSYTIYTLSHPITGEVLYVGRTSDFTKRMKAHKLNPYRSKLNPNVLHENLSYEQARAAEQLYIMLYCTLDKTSKAKNQINGVNPYRKDYLDIMHNGFGLNEALDSILTNELLILFE